MSVTASPLLNWALGPYRIARELGRGQFGTVYEATDAQGRDIALKLVPVQGADSEAKVAAERQGAALQQRFSRTAHALVPDVLDHQRIDPYYAIAMELVRGQSLATLISFGRLSADRAATIAGAVCGFLVAAHEFTADLDDRSRTILVHGDLKPAHVLIVPDGSVRVLDFGIAKALASRNAATTNLWSSVDYASPERLDSGRVNEHADFWALGVMLFEMLAGVRPYVDYEHSRSRLEAAIRNQEARLRLPADVDPRLVAIVEKILAPQLEHRYQSAQLIRADLQAFLDRRPVLAFAEAARANQATLRISAAAERPSSRATLPTEPLPAPPSPAPVATMPPGNAKAPAAREEPVRGRYAPWIAAALSFLAPGLGQLYNRDFLRGIFWLIVTPGFWVGSAGLLGWPFHIIAACTAYRRARRSSADTTPASVGPAARNPPNTPATVCAR
jgi:serine/threonine protein kinase